MAGLSEFWADDLSGVGLILGSTTLVSNGVIERKGAPTALRGLDCLNQSYGAVTAVVTGIYALFTILLWIATKRQADITRRMFEAGHRPYVAIQVEGNDIPPR